MWHCLTVKKTTTPSRRQSKSGDITGSNSSFILISAMSCGWVQTNIRGFRKYDTFIVVGNELHAVTWQRNIPAASCTQRPYCSGDLHPGFGHTVVKLHSIKEWTDDEKTGAGGDRWGRAETPDTGQFSNINCSAHLMATRLHGTGVLPQCVLPVFDPATRQPEGSIQLSTRHRLTAAPSTCLCRRSISALFTLIQIRPRIK